MMMRCLDRDLKLFLVSILPAENWANGRLTAMEAGARAIDESDYRGVAGRLIEFPGNLGLLIGGGGASLTIFDAILNHGGEPANYCEIGGNPTPEKVARLTRVDCHTTKS